MSIMVGVGTSAGAGVLIKNAEALERMERVDTLVVDKTGTLTEGKPRVVAVVTASGFDAAELLSLTASLEQGSEHPLAAAIVAAAKAREAPLQEASDFQSLTGKGVAGKVGGRTVALGNAVVGNALRLRLTQLTAVANREGVNPAKLTVATVLMLCSSLSVAVASTACPIARPEIQVEAGHGQLGEVTDVTLAQLAQVAREQARPQRHPLLGA